MDADNDADDYLFRCVICGTTESDNLTSTSSLQTNATVKCGHQFCTACIDRELSRKREFACGICGSAVKRVTLTQRTLDDVQAEKDTGWRRRVLKVFNKTQADFAMLQEYNDYLEEVEDMIFSIVNEEPEAEEHKAKIKEYESKHKAEIVIRQSQRADEERSIQDRIASQIRESERMKREIQHEEQVITKAKRRLKIESTEVILGERDQISAELRQAQMQGYRNEVKRQAQGQKASGNWVTPKVREPDGGLARDDKIDREVYRKRQAAGGGILPGSILSHERNWNETTSSLFCLR